MANRRLSDTELEHVNGLLGEIREKLRSLSGGDDALHWAARRKVYKELAYDERGKPMQRRRLKELKRAEQNGICPLCKKPLPTKYVVLDRLEAMGGYTLVNTRLIHQDCDTAVQASRGYT